jgi:hypothetical protein
MVNVGLDVTFHPTEDGTQLVPNVGGDNKKKRKKETVVVPLESDRLSAYGLQPVKQKSKKKSKK